MTEHAYRSPAIGPEAATVQRVELLVRLRKHGV